MDKKDIKNRSTPGPVWGIIMVVFVWISTAIVFFPIEGPAISPMLANARILAGGLDLILFLALVYWVIILRLERSNKFCIILNTTIKSKLRYRDSIHLAHYAYSITAEGWFWGFGVSKEIYDSINEGDQVEITYGKFSKYLKNIKIMK